jgi:chromosome segregation ATPase
MGETKSEPENSSNTQIANEAQDDIAGRDVLILLRRSAELADGNSRYAIEIAQKMSDQLWAAQKRVAELQARVTELEAQVQLYPARIADLEAEVQLYRDKSAELQARHTELEAQVQLYPTRIADLEAEVQLYRDKSEKAEQWLGKISNEIQQRVLGGDNQVVERPIPR